MVHAIVVVGTVKFSLPNYNLVMAVYLFPLSPLCFQFWWL